MCTEVPPARTSSTSCRAAAVCSGAAASWTRKRTSTLVSIAQLTGTGPRHSGPDGPAAADAQGDTALALRAGDRPEWTALSNSSAVVRAKTHRLADLAGMLKARLGGRLPPRSPEHPSGRPAVVPRLGVHSAERPVQQLHGHADVRTTGAYAVVGDDAVADAMERLLASGAPTV